MTTRTSRWTADLLAVLVLTVLATATVLVDIEGSLLRTALVAPFVVFLPGYALVSLLFPESPREQRPDDSEPVAAPGTVGEGVSTLARVGLATASSIAMLPAVMLVFNFALGGIRVVETLLTLAALTVVLTLLALVRRFRLPATERFAVFGTGSLSGAVTSPFRVRHRSLARSSTFQPSSKRGVLLNLVLVVSVVALVSSVAVGYAFPTQGQQFTEMYLVTESPDGEFVAADYPRNFTVGQSRPVYVAVSNHEGERQSYTLVAELHRVDQTPNGTRVTQSAELMQVSRTVGAGETVRIRHDIQPPFGGGRLRVQYLLYRDDPAANPMVESAYRSTHIWITVGGQQAGGG